MLTKQMRTPALSLILLFAAASATADTAPSINEFLEAAGHKKSIKALDGGKLIWQGRKEQEADDTALAGAVLGKFRASIPEILDVMNNDPEVTTYELIPIDDSSPEALADSFANVEISSEDKKEIDFLLNPEPTDKFNYSALEISALAEFAEDYRAGGSGFDSDAQAATAAFRILLTNRYLTYTKQGMSSLEPYQQKGGKQIDVAEKFELAVSVWGALPQFFPDFIQALEAFPEAPATGYEHEFSLTESEASGRPLFLLNHAMTDIQDDYAVLALREFYVSHTLDFLTVLTILIQEGDYTLVGILTQTSTGLISGMARPVAAPIGRTIMAYNMRPILEVLRERFP